MPTFDKGGNDVTCIVGLSIQRHQLNSKLEDTGIPVGIGITVGTAIPAGIGVTEDTAIGSR